MSLRPATYDLALERQAKYAQNRRAKLKSKGKGNVLRGAKRQPGLDSAQVRPVLRLNRRLGPGPRMKKWARVWRWLKPRLESAGRTFCEFDFIPHYCWGRLDPCHSKKRRLWEGDDIYAVAIGCENIHQILDEVLSHEKMEVEVMKAIDRHGGLILPERN